MHSYETLVLLALALSTAFPVLSAPVRYASHSSTPGGAFSHECYYSSRGSQQQARANVDERGIGTSLLKTVGISGVLGAGIPALEHFLGGGDGSDSTRRAMSRDEGNTTPGHIFFDGRPVNLDQRAPAGLGGLLDDALESSDSLGKVIGDNIVNGLAAGATAFGANKLLGNKNK
jgi:hypothetical protein